MKIRLDLRYSPDVLCETLCDLENWLDQQLVSGQIATSQRARLTIQTTRGHSSLSGTARDITTALMELSSSYLSLWHGLAPFDGKGTATVPSPHVLALVRVLYERQDLTLRNSQAASYG